jgi:hypothetical protein
MMWLNTMRIVQVAAVMAGTGIAVGKTWADEEPGKPLTEPTAPLLQTFKSEPTTRTLDDPKVEIGNLRSDIATLRLELHTALREIKSLQAALRLETVIGVAGPRYRGKSVAFWLEQFKDADPKFRADAVEALGTIAQKNKELIPVLLAALKEKNGLVEPKAVVALSLIGKEVVPALVDALRDKSSPYGRRSAAQALGQIGPDAKDAVPALCQVLQEDDLDLRGHAVVALHSIGPDAKVAIPALLDTLGPSIKTYKTQNESRDKPGAEITGPQIDSIFRALLRIDPEIHGILPRPFLLSVMGRPEEVVPQWQKVYEVLKTRYQKET